MDENRKTILSLKNVEVKFNVRGRVLTAIRGVDFDIYENESIAIVGESGSGKSVLTKTFTGMLDSNGFISNGSIVYSDDELSKVEVKLTKAKVQGYNQLLDRLNFMSRLSFGKQEYLEIKRLEKENKERFTLSQEEQQQFNKEIADIDFKIVDLFNKKQLLDHHKEKQQIQEIEEQTAKLKVEKESVIAKYQAIKQQRYNSAKGDTNKNLEYQAKINALKAKRNELIKQEVDRETKNLNAKIAQEIYLSIDRFPFFAKKIAQRKILKALYVAYSKGEKLTDDRLNDLFDVATFRVALTHIDADVYKTLTEEETKNYLKEARNLLNDENLLKTIQEFATENKVNTLFVYKAAEEFTNKGLNKLDEKTISHLLSKTLRKETIKEGNVIHGYTQLDLAKIKLNRDWQKIRGVRIATVFQDPMTSLNPIVTIGQQIIEVIMKHQKVDMAEAKKRAISIMTRVGIPDAEKRFKEYPFQYSGGMRQRIVIAIALSCRPKVLICDEPTTALDVTIQAQIIELIKDLQKEFKFTTIYITHDLGVVASVADRVAVLYAGQIVEAGKVEEIFYDPRHPYTWALLSSLPQLAEKGKDLYSIVGTPPSLYNVIKGDAFAERNPYCLKVDLEDERPYFYVSDTHFAKTWLLDPRAPKVDKPQIIENLHEKLTKNLAKFNREEYAYERRNSQRSDSGSETHRHNLQKR